MSQNFLQQLRANVVALTSLAVAFAALGYNTWRNEHSERNRNIRVAAFEILKELGELQQVVNSSLYAKDRNRSDPLAGWGRVAMITDLSELLPSPAPEHAAELHRVWQADWHHLSDKEENADQISAEIDRSRESIREILRNLH